MARQRKSSAILERTGAYAKNPQRRRHDPKGHGELPVDPPADLRLNATESAAWREIVAGIPRGIGTGSDAITVELAARILGELRAKRRYIPSRISQLRALINALGLSPAARANLGALGESADANPFDEFRSSHREHRGALPN